MTSVPSSNLITALGNARKELLELSSCPSMLQNVGQELVYEQPGNIQPLRRMIRKACSIESRTKRSAAIFFDRFFNAHAPRGWVRLCLNSRQNQPDLAHAVITHTRLHAE